MNQMPRAIETPEVEEKTQEQKLEERSMILERIAAIYEEPIKSKASLARMELAIQNLYTRKRALEVE